MTQKDRFADLVSWASEALATAEDPVNVVLAAYKQGFEEGCIQAAQKASMPEDPYNPYVQQISAKMALRAPILQLEFTTRTYNCLIRERLYTIYDVVRCSADELSDIRNFGNSCLAEVRHKLGGVGYTLREDPLPKHPQPDAPAPATD